MIAEAVEITIGIVLIGIRLGFTSATFSIPYFRSAVKNNENSDIPYSANIFKLSQDFLPNRLRKSK